MVQDCSSQWHLKVCQRIWGAWCSLLVFIYCYSYYYPFPFTLIHPSESSWLPHRQLIILIVFFSSFFLCFGHYVLSPFGKCLLAMYTRFMALHTGAKWKPTWLLLNMHSSTRTFVRCGEVRLYFLQYLQLTVSIVAAVFYAYLCGHWGRWKALPVGVWVIIPPTLLAGTSAVAGIGMLVKVGRSSTPLHW